MPNDNVDSSKHEIVLPTDYDLLSREQRKEVRELYIEKQDKRCLYCKESLSSDPPDRITKREINWSLFPLNFLKYPIHLQHNHYTGMTEGAVHAYCNAVMWQYEGR